MPSGGRRPRHCEFAEFYADYDRHQGFYRNDRMGVDRSDPLHLPRRYSARNFKAAARVAKATALFMAAVAPATVAPDRIYE
jgi:hypothetical protein